MQKPQKNIKPIYECVITHRNEETYFRVTEKNIQKITRLLYRFSGIKEDEKDKNQEPP